jgi:hypothetical protein
MIGLRPKGHQTEASRLLRDNARHRPDIRRARHRSEASMFNATVLLAEALGRHLAETYERRYGGRDPEYGRLTC